MLDVQIRGSVSSYLFVQYFPGNVELTYRNKAHLTFYYPGELRGFGHEEPADGPF